MIRYSLKPGITKHVKGCGFLSFARNLSNKYGKKILDTAIKTELDTTNIFSKRVHQTAETKEK